MLLCSVATKRREQLDQESRRREREPEPEPRSAFQRFSDRVRYGGRPPSHRPETSRLTETLTLLALVVLLAILAKVFGLEF